METDQGEKISNLKLSSKVGEDKGKRKAAPDETALEVWETNPTKSEGLKAKPEKEQREQDQD